uniref:Secreted protein n=1 Tax=Heterorhabditis bacteriophora TaxID=37862 RepID=A0A1I7WR54_HETBA
MAVHFAYKWCTYVLITHDVVSCCSSNYIYNTTYREMMDKVDVCFLCILFTFYRDK